MTDVRITLYEDGHPRDITLAYPLEDEHAELLGELYRGGGLKGVIECRMHDDDPALRDLRDGSGRVRGIWLYLQRRHGRLFLCHWPDAPAKGSHAVPSPMSPEHRKRQEYIALRGEASGYSVELERSIAPGTRSDVVVTGAATMAAEVQQSGIPVATVLRRSERAAEAGATSTWFADSKNPAWAFRVPHVETNKRVGLDPRTWTVSTGPRKLEHELCSPSSRFASCPKGRPNWCGEWHEMWTPLAGLTVDDVVEQVPAGQLVKVETGAVQGTILATPTDAREWLEAHPHVALPSPRQEDSRPRAAPHHSDYGAAKVRRRLDAGPAPTAAPPARGVPGPMPRTCPNCREMPPGPGGGYCTRCFFFPKKFRATGGDV